MVEILPPTLSRIRFYRQYDNFYVRLIRCERVTEVNELPVLIDSLIYVHISTEVELDPVRHIRLYQDDWFRTNPCGCYRWEVPTLGLNIDAWAQEVIDLVIGPSGAWVHTRGTYPVREAWNVVERTRALLMAPEEDSEEE